jgi:hypothetical protein
MEKEGGLLADRPRAVAAGEILSRGLRMILAPAGEQFRRLRKLCRYLLLPNCFSEDISSRAAHTHLQAKAAESYAPIQMDAARDVILDILDNPKGHQAAANRCVVFRGLFYNYLTHPTQATLPRSSCVSCMESPRLPPRMLPRSSSSTKCLSAFRCSCDLGRSS